MDNTDSARGAPGAKPKRSEGLVEHLAPLLPKIVPSQDAPTWNQPLLHGAGLSLAHPLYITQIPFPTNTIRNLLQVGDRQLGRRVDPEGAALSS